MSKINIYACGGAGINVAKFFESHRGRKEPGLASIDPIYIDTSLSNIDPILSEESTYIIEGLDGSGKIRSENYSVISESVLDILLKHPVGDLNIVLSSGSGGSGSVIAPSLVSELLNRDKPTLVFIIGSSDSGIELNNTVRTLKSYEAIAKLRTAPVVAMYFENSEKTSRKIVNLDAQKALAILAVFFSGENTELDSSDVKNWLKYTKVTSFQPHLSMMDFSIKTLECEKGVTPIAVITLAEEDSVTTLGVPVEYQAVGYASKDIFAKLKLTPAVHAVILDGTLTSIYKRLDKDLAALNEAKAARSNIKVSILDSTDTPTSNGLVL